MCGSQFCGRAFELKLRVDAREHDGEVEEGTQEVLSGEDVPDPFETFKTMTDYLEDLDEFAFSTRSESDQVLESGETVQVSSRRTVSLDRDNDKLAVTVETDGEKMHALYDGNTFTFFSRSQNLYVQLDMPDSVDDALSTLATDYGFAPPLADMLYSEIYDSMISRTLTGQYVGLHQVNMEDCHHLAFTETGIDWEIWINAGDEPIPEKFSITYKNQPGSPRFTATLVRWEDTPAPLAFELNTPSDAQKVEIEEAEVTEREGLPE